MGYAIVSIRCAVVVVFAVSVLSKVHSGRAFYAFRDWLAGVGLPILRGSHTLAAVGVVCGEITAGVLVAMPSTAWTGLVMAAGIFGVFAVGVIWAVRRRIRVPCRCLGPSRAPLGLWHAVRNLALCCIAGVGAAGFGPAVTRPGGLVLSLGTGMTAAILVVFAEDLTRLRHPVQPETRFRPGEIR